MNLNDIILTIVFLAFSYSLIPQIIESIKNRNVDISFQTILITGIGLFIVSAINFRMSLFFNSIITFITSLCWIIILGYLKLKLKKG